jgi:hypothetical protein
LGFGDWMVLSFIAAVSHFLSVDSFNERISSINFTSSLVYHEIMIRFPQRVHPHHNHC